MIKTMSIINPQDKITIINPGYLSSLFETKNLYILFLKLTDFFIDDIHVLLWPLPHYFLSYYVIGKYISFTWVQAWEKKHILDNINVFHVILGYICLLWLSTFSIIACINMKETQLSLLLRQDNIRYLNSVRLSIFSHILFILCLVDPNYCK